MPLTKKIFLCSIILLFTGIHLFVFTNIEILNAVGYACFITGIIFIPFSIIIDKQERRKRSERTNPNK